VSDSQGSAFATAAGGEAVADLCLASLDGQETI
jgi:hypothetical protein